MAARKSRLYLNSFIPVNQTKDDVVRNIFRPGKFACTITASLQLVGIISLCANLFIVIVSNYCRYHPSNRRLNIGSAVATICNSTALYFIFCCGYAVNNPSLWVKINIISNFTLSVITIVVQTVSMDTCLTLEQVHKSPGPMAIVGGGCLVLSCISLFILYRYRELDVDIVIERKLSEDRSSVTQVVSRKVSAPARLEHERKRSGDHCHPYHIKGQIYVKQEDDDRKCSLHSLCDWSNGNGPKRKAAVNGRHEDNTSYTSNRMYHIHRKMSPGAGQRQEEDYPHCSKSRRKSPFHPKY